MNCLKNVSLFIPCLPESEPLEIQCYGDSAPPKVILPTTRGLTSEDKAFFKERVRIAYRIADQIKSGQLKLNHPELTNG